MSGQKPKKDNRSQPETPQDDEREAARQQSMKDESRDQGDTSANREMIRENTTQQHTHTK